MHTNLKFRTGKYAGKSYEWVNENDPGYINWVLENRPEMMRSKQKPKTVTPSYLKDVGEDEEDTVQRLKPLKPNYNFEKQLDMSENDKATREKEVKAKLLKLKLGLYSKLTKETDDKGKIKYDKNWLADIVFDREEESELKEKIKSRINENY